jgi:hypothetical protein
MGKPAGGRAQELGGRENQDPSLAKYNIGIRDFF